MSTNGPSGEAAPSAAAGQSGSGRSIGTGWSEVYSGGDPETERVEFEELARMIMDAQAIARRKASRHGAPQEPARALHAKPTLALPDAHLRFVDDLSPDLQHGYARPGADYRTVVRFSNASNVGEPDFKPDLRGVALRVEVDGSESHDLLMTNFPVSHARNARQFVEFAHATAGEGASRLAGLVRLMRLFGPRETLRMLKNVTTARRHEPGSVFTETYWSRGALCWGDRLAVRYLLCPAPDTPPAAPSTTDRSYLSNDAVRRMRAGEVRMELFVQRFRDEASTPIEDTAVEWTEQVAPRERVAILTFGKGDVTSADALAAAQVIESLAFNPWNTTEAFRPLGNLNRARKTAYDASAAVRGATRWHT